MSATEAAIPQNVVEGDAAAAPAKKEEVVEAVATVDSVDSDNVEEKCSKVCTGPGKFDIPDRKWDDAALGSDECSKRELVQFMHEQAAPRFLAENKLKGNLKSVVKSSKRDHVLKCYMLMYKLQAFKGSDYDIDVVIDKVVSETKDLSLGKKAAADVVEEVPRFKKFTLKKGDKVNFPKRGDMVQCFYTGKLEDGTVFDSLQPGTKKKRNQPLKFKVGKGHVIKGWDEVLLTMSVGEKAEVKIESVWAYGKVGKPEAKIPPNANLIFEIELTRVD